MSENVDEIGLTEDYSKYLSARIADKARTQEALKELAGRNAYAGGTDDARLDVRLKRLAVTFQAYLEWYQQRIDEQRNLQTRAIGLSVGILVALPVILFLSNWAAVSIQPAGPAGSGGGWIATQLGILIAGLLGAFKALTEWNQKRLRYQQLWNVTSEIKDILFKFVFKWGNVVELWVDSKNWPNVTKDEKDGLAGAVDQAFVDIRTAVRKETGEYFAKLETLPALDYMAAVSSGTAGATFGDAVRRILESRVARDAETEKTELSIKLAEAELSALKAMIDQRRATLTTETPERKAALELSIKAMEAEVMSKEVALAVSKAKSSVTSGSRS